MIKLEVDAKSKAFLVVVSGLVTAEEAAGYLEKLEAGIRTVDPGQYKLVIDAREQKAVSPDTIPFLEKAMKLYGEAPFAARYSVVLESAIAMQQVKRVGKDDLGKFIMVKSVEEALK